MCPYKIDILEFLIQNPNPLIFMFSVLNNLIVFLSMSELTGRTHIRSYILSRPFVIRINASKGEKGP